MSEDIKLYKMLKENGYSKVDLIATLNKMNGYTDFQLTQISKDKHKPVMVRVIADLLKEK